MIRRLLLSKPSSSMVTVVLLFAIIVSTSFLFTSKDARYMFSNKIRKKYLDDMTSSAISSNVNSPTLRSHSMIDTEPLQNNLNISEPRTTSIKHAIQSFQCKYDCSVDRKQSEIFESKPRNDVFLTIGIPTIVRTGGSYLNDTLTSLIAALSPEEYSQVLILVFLADYDPTLKNKLAQDLYRTFGEYIESGLVRIIQAPRSFYPTEDIKRLTYRQSKRYVKWRSKQCYDFAYMFKYSLNISKYYMQIEDDVTTRGGFLKDIKNYINEQKDWICLEFSVLGFIGKLYRTEHLERLSIMLMMFYSEQPVDTTYLDFNHVMLQGARKIRKPTLFQHNGLHSSFSGKIQRLQDHFYNRNEKVIKGNNPPADVKTNMKTYMELHPHLAYTLADGFYWSHGVQKAGDSFTVTFKEPQKLKRVAIVTGAVNAPFDKIYNGKVEVSLVFDNTTKPDDCGNRVEIGTFQDGLFENTDLLSVLKYRVSCIVITVTRDKDTWIIIREIAVFTA